MKKLALIALATVISTSAMARDIDHYNRQVPDHNEIPALQATSANQSAFTHKNDDAQKLVYVGETTKANLVVKERMGSDH
ncbi:hypothetical protein [Kingella negevensis]|uniref:hypothetical protein n=1 Tax=Kingella negevensis TaxID=1522312 RepID=UPI00050A02FD|nr:hypothetical protein [Kingella negevensis]